MNKIIIVVCWTVLNWGTGIRKSQHQSSHDERFSVEQRWNEHTPMHFREFASRSDSLRHTKMLSEFSSQIETDRRKLKHLANQDYTQLMERGCFFPPFPIILVDSN